MKARFEKHKKWTGKGNKGFEKSNILEWEKPTAWRVEVRGVTHLAALLISDQLRHNPRIPYPVRWLGFVVPTLPQRTWKDGALLWEGLDLKNSGCATRRSLPVECGRHCTSSFAQTVDVVILMPMLKALKSP